jgi:hypothetical protein
MSGDKEKEKAGDGVPESKIEARQERDSKAQAQVDRGRKAREKEGTPRMTEGRERGQAGQ